MKLDRSGYAVDEVGREVGAEFETKLMRINVGPQHPSTHGVLRLVVDLDGERIVRLTPQIGYLHTGFEKTMENRTYQQVVTYSNRMDYAHSLGHDLAYVLSAEQLIGASVPERAQRVRVLLTELNRIASHLLFVGTGVLDMGALTLFFYTMREREAILKLLEMVTGVRMNYGYFRVGGLATDLPEGFVEEARKFLDGFPAMVDQYTDLIAKNDIFLQRTRGIGVIPAERAIADGLTGPSLRASGVALDQRKAAPYSGYEDYDFEVPTSDVGDAHARIEMRFREFEQSARICRQALDRLEPGRSRTPTGASACRRATSSRPRWRRSSSTSSWSPRASTRRAASPTSPPSRPAASWGTTWSATAARCPTGSRCGSPA
jgi:NADH-quinone oxidoreductase subunit D